MRGIRLGSSGGRGPRNRRIHPRRGRRRRERDLFYAREDKATNGYKFRNGAGRGEVKDRPRSSTGRETGTDPWKKKKKKERRKRDYSRFYNSWTAAGPLSDR